MNSIPDDRAPRPAPTKRLNGHTTGAAAILPAAGRVLDWAQGRLAGEGER